MLRILTGEEAIRFLENDPKSVIFPLGLFMMQFDLTFDEVKAEAASGRLRLQGRPTDDGYDHVNVSMESLIDWLANPKTPRVFVDRFFKYKSVGVA